MTVCLFRLFPAQTDRRTERCISNGRKVLCTQTPVVTLLISFTVTVSFIKGTDYEADK
jgi:hypothetical protein